MTENYIVNLVAWIILYASFWLTKHNPVSTAFRRRECHTGFLAKWLEKTIFPFRWYGSRPTYEYAIGLLLLCCILFTVSLHISVAHFDLPQIYFDTVTNTADLHSSAASVQCAAITASSSMSLELKRSYIL